LAKTFLQLLGCAGGLVAGLGLGGGITYLLDGFASDIWLFVLPHSMLAMMVMGGWSLPSLMSK
jgi:hypothetical protein